MAKLRNKIKKAYFLYLLIFVVTMGGVFFAKYKSINARYPNPLVEVVFEGEKLNLNEYEVSVTNVNKTCFANLAGLFPESMYFKEEAEKNRLDVYLIRLKITGIGNSNQPITIYNTTLASGNSSNGMDLFAYNEINDKDPVVCLAKGESIELILPYTLIDTTDGDKELIFALYPTIKKIILNTTDAEMDNSSDA